MRLTFVTTHDPSDPNLRSGWPYYMKRALLEAGYDVESVGPLDEHRVFLNRLRAKAHRTVTGRGFHPYRQEENARKLARQVSAAVAEERPDVVFSTECVPIAHLESDVPIVLWADATFASLVDFYPEFTKLSRTTLRDGHAMEAAALERCTLAIFSSRWAARSAIERYGVPPDRVAVVPWGANLDAVPDRSAVERRILDRRRSQGPCSLVFVGRAWVRKGGPLAVEILRDLNRRGVPATLTVVGCEPPLGADSASIRVIGELDRRTDSGQSAYASVLSDADALILPSNADCTPIAIAEAAAFGVPTVCSDVGGVSEVVESNRTGWVLPHTASVDDYVKAIQQVADRSDRIAEVDRAAREAFETRLNWATAVQRVHDLVAKLA